MTTTTPPDARNALAEIVAGNRRWRIFEAATARGYWGIELEDADNDDDAIMYPIKIHRDTVSRIVEAHNASLVSSQDARIAALEAQVEGMRVALGRISNCGQSAQPDHWLFRQMARETARAALQSSETTGEK